MLGAFLVWLSHKEHFAQTDDEGKELLCFSTGPAIRNTFSDPIIAIIASFVLIFAIFYISSHDIPLIPYYCKIDLGLLSVLTVAIQVWLVGLSRGDTTRYTIKILLEIWAPELRMHSYPLREIVNGVTLGFRL